MSDTKTLLNALLCDIYGKQEQQARRLRRCRHHRGQDKRGAREKRASRRSSNKGPLARMASTLAGNERALQALSVRQLIDVSAMLKVEILMMGYLLERVLITRDRQRRHQEVLCEFVTAVLIVETNDAQPKMRFSLSPPPPKVSLTSPTSTANSSTGSTYSTGTINNNHSSGRGSGELGRFHTSHNNNNMLGSTDDADDAASDYNQWLHAMKLVARLPGGTPPEFRRKLWLSLADKYLKSKNVDWTQQREKCFCEEWREDDEELGIQIVKDLHRTGSNLCTGPAGSINQAKLKRILLGYARYNPEVGYCQGFNMLGALILQVMDKEEEESMKVMIYLVEGVLPTGYFYGSMGGLQADMGVFRELMQTKLPRLAKHLQRLQGPMENAYEPPLTNVFTMQWFLTMFCTCLPMSCVLRVWDLVLIEGSDVLLRTALVLWSLLEERVLNARSADEFYGKMGSFSNELLNGHLIDSNGLIEKVVQLGPIEDLKQLRDKHLYHITPIANKQGLQLYYDDEDTHSDDESRLAVATMWGLNWGRRGSGVGVAAQATGKPHSEQKDRLALDISLLKKQYDRLRERQKQAHVILTTACSTATAPRQGSLSSAPAAPVPVNQLLLGRPAIVTNKGKRVGAPLGAIPPARKPSLPAVLHGKPAERQLRRGETLLWRDTDATRHRRDSLTWKEIRADRAAMLREGSEVKSQKLRSRLGKSDSSSYSEESDGEPEAVGKDGSSTDTSLCDDDDPKSMEKSPKRKAKLARKLNEKSKAVDVASRESSLERRRPKSWAPSTHEIPFMLMGTDSGDEKDPATKEEEDSATESDRFGYARDVDWSRAAGDLAYSKLEPLHIETGADKDVITSTSQLSPLPDIASYLSTTSISPLPTPKPVYVMSESEMPTSPQDIADISLKDDLKRFDISDAGVTNQYFERVNSVERPSRLELSYSLNDDEMDVPEVKEDQRRLVEGQCEEDVAKALPVQNLTFMGERDDNIPGENKDDYKEVLSMTIEGTQPAPSTQPATTPLSHASRKRRDPRRKTLTRSSTIEIEERFQALERRLSQEQPSGKPHDVRLERTKFIPTTASLEERYNTLEKQLSSEKQQQQQQQRLEDAVCLEKPPSDNIPSTADLELRFNALTKQLSSSDTNHSKAPVDLNGQDEPSGSSNSRRGNEAEKPDRSEQSKSDAVNQPAKNSEKVETSRKNEDSNEENEPHEDRPRLKKLPSTAELEDRFNALERKMSVQKSSPAKTREKPPDETVERGEEHEKPTGSKFTEKSEEIPKKKSEERPQEKSQEKSRQEPETKPKEKSKEKLQESPKSPQSKNDKIEEAKSVSNDAKQLKKEAKIEEEVVTKEKTIKNAEKTEKKTATPDSEKIPVKSPTKQTKVEQVKQLDKAEKKAEAKKETEVAKRKTPPSTEELEKRFNALEKQLSTSQIEPQPIKEKQTKLEEGDKQIKKTEEKARSSVKSFDAKVMEISASLKGDETGDTSEVKEQQSKTEDNRSETKKPSASSASKTDVSPKQSTHPKADPPDPQPEHESQPQSTKSKEQNKRRASEPPSMEDLEQRYERLKRRLSNRNQLTNQNETVNEALERIEQEVMAELGDPVDDLEEEEEVPRVTRRQTPPSTEDLESRYEALHKEKSSAAEEKKKPKSPPHHVDVAIEAHIPDAPPPPPPTEHMMTLPAAGQRQQQALIEELQSKMRGQSPGEENLKPSEINPQRRRHPETDPRQLQQRPTPMGDETSEAPANTAYYRSGNYEPWPGGQRMVRRFSDLPSRADLENRLQFLERKLYKRFYKQRCASDSEVASRSAATSSISCHHQHYDEQPSTSRQAEAQLEQRVLALEKQLSENSLKLLEAMREKVALTDAEENASPRRLSSDSETGQGKELVRYTQNLGELGEDSDKPINISINIKMLLNKEGEQKKPPAPDSSSTDDLRRRLEQLEQQLLDERAKHAAAMQDCELLTAEPAVVVEDTPEIVAKMNAKVADKVEDKVETEMETKIEDGGKQEKDCHNQIVKHVEAEKLEEQATPTTPKQTTCEPEVVKESKTLQNEERAQIRNKEAEVNTGKESRKESSQAEVTEKQREDKVDKTSLPVEPPKSTPALTQAELEQPPVETKQTGEDAQPVQTAVDDKTVVLLMDNEPRALKVRRLTRANTEELEGLFQALEKQLNDRNLVKSKDGKLVRVEATKPSTEQLEQAQAISDLTKEIEDFTAGPKPEAEETKADPKTVAEPEEDPNYDWGPNPVKHHLKRKTVYLPSTKELEARFRSLERQIKLLEDVEKIDVEQRLNEIERKIKLQYSLSHEKDLNKYIELCEGKGLDDDPVEDHVETDRDHSATVERSRSRSPARKECGKSSPYTSPGRKAATNTVKSPKSPYVSPSRKAATSTVKSPKSPYVSPSRRGQKTPPSSHTSPVRKSPYTSPARRDEFPYSDDLEYKYRVLDLVRSKSKEQLAKRKQDPNKKPPIHPLEMLLDPSPDSSEIPTTGELEHRIRLLDEKLKSPGAARHKSRSRSPTIDDIKRQKMLSEQRPRTPVHSLERMVYSPDRPEPPTAAELEQRMLALEQEQSFDFKTQKDYKEFNQKLKDVVSPSYEEFMTSRSREQSPRRATGSTTPKSAMRRDTDNDEYREKSSKYYRPTSPKVIRFREEEEERAEDEPSWRTRSQRSSERMTLADQSASAGRSAVAAASSMEGLDAFGSRLMRETSPITRTGTHTGVPLRTGENINDRLSSIKNSIKSIDSLCEEKPYRKEKCQRYIDSLFSDSTHFASKKSSAEDLTHSRSESRGRTTAQRSDDAPTIRISSEHRSLGSAESLRSAAAASPPSHYRSHRDLSRDLSPRGRQRRDQEREEREERENSRVRCDTKMPNYLADNRSEVAASAAASSRSSLTKFHQVDRQLEETCARYADNDRRSASRSPLSSPYEARNTTRYNNHTSHQPGGDSSFPRAVSPYRQPYYDPSRSTPTGARTGPTPVYQPAKLEIRHTTVTSTFYDRFLMEKQIEKQQTVSRPPSRSPLGGATSPSPSSAISKSYSDLPASLAKSGESLLDAISAVAASASVTSTNSYSPMSRSYGGYSYLTSNTAHSQATGASSERGLSPSSSTAVAPASTSISISTATTTSTSAFVPYTFSSSFSSRLKSEQPDSTTSGLSSYSTGVYNPMMSFTLREPSSGTAPFQYKSGYSYGSTAPAKSDSEKP